MRWVAARPQSNRRCCFPASTRMLGPKRSILGCGEPVPRRVTFKSCAVEDPARVMHEDNSKTLVHHGCLLMAGFGGRSRSRVNDAIDTVKRASISVSSSSAKVLSRLRSICLENTCGQQCSELISIDPFFGNFSVLHSKNHDRVPCNGFSVYVMSSDPRTQDSSPRSLVRESYNDPISRLENIVQSVWSTSFFFAPRRHELGKFL